MTPETWTRSEPLGSDPLHCEACARPVPYLVGIGQSRMRPAAELCASCVELLAADLAAVKEDLERRRRPDR